MGRLFSVCALCVMKMDTEGRFIFFSLFHWISVNNLNDMRDIYTDISYYIHLIPIDVSTQSWLASIQREDLVEDRDNSHTYYQRTLL